MANNCFQQLREINQESEPCADPSVNEPGDGPANNKHDLNYLQGNHTPQAKRYFDGIAANAQIIGISKAALLDSDAQSPFHSIASATGSHEHLPPSLRPTEIQQQFKHHPFFDCIPIPAFRDRAILATTTEPPMLNRFVICFDMFAGGLNFTGDSTDEQCWSFSDDFRDKWGNLFDFDLDELKTRASQCGS